MSRSNTRFNEDAQHSELPDRAGRSNAIDGIVGLVTDYSAGLSYDTMARRIGVKASNPSARFSGFFSILRALGYPMPSRPRKAMPPEVIERNRKRMKAVWRAARDAGIVEKK